VSLRLPKRERKCLAPEPYRELLQKILRRDGWLCQSCGRLEELQVHHIEARSRLGQDTEEKSSNLGPVGDL